MEMIRNDPNIKETYICKGSVLIFSVSGYNFIWQDTHKIIILLWVC